MNSDYSSQQQAFRPETNKTSLELSDPMETLLEAAARLRVLERLLQHALAPESASERRSLLRRYNRQRRELRQRLDTAPRGRTRLLQEQFEVSIAGPLRQDSSDQTVNTAIASIHRALDQLVIA